MTGAELWLSQDTTSMTVPPIALGARGKSLVMSTSTTMKGPPDLSHHVREPSGSEAARTCGSHIVSETAARRATGLGTNHSLIQG